MALLCRRAARARDRGRRKRSGRETILGNDLAAGHSPQLAVPAHHWQTAQSLGAWTLAGCTVAPGFEFAGFQLAPKGWSPGG
jgi:predicted cupin superfamily sugar epimerase